MLQHHGNRGVVCRGGSDRIDVAERRADQGSQWNDDVGLFQQRQDGALGANVAPYRREIIMMAAVVEGVFDRKLPSTMLIVGGLIAIIFLVINIFTFNVFNMLDDIDLLFSTLLWL